MTLYCKTRCHLKSSRKTSPAIGVAFSAATDQSEFVVGWASHMCVERCCCLSSLKWASRRSGVCLVWWQTFRRTVLFSSGATSPEVMRAVQKRSCKGLLSGKADTWALWNSLFLERQTKSIPDLHLTNWKRIANYVRRTTGYSLILKNRSNTKEQII